MIDYYLSDIRYAIHYYKKSITLSQKLGSKDQGVLFSNNVYIQCIPKGLGAGILGEFKSYFYPEVIEFYEMYLDNI
jgi:hypothetical protein